MTSKQLILNEYDLIELEKELCARSLAEFVRLSWPILEPGQEYIHGWHVDAICEHLEAITREEINRLLINIPPGTMKSTLVNVFWPVWEWGPAGLGHHKIISASHARDLAVRDTRKMRRIIESEWFQRRWPMGLAADQNEKTYYENDYTGFRQACAVKSMTGRRGDRVLWDDPSSVEASLSEPERIVTARVFHETLPTRLINPDRSAIVVVMQRLHEEDVSGIILEEDHGYEHLCLPMEFEPSRRCITSIGFSDPRTEEGELLFPERFPREVVERDKKILGSAATAGQFQQAPAPRAGNLIEWEKIKIVQDIPAMRTMVRYWDKAGTENGGKRTAGVLMGEGVDGYFYIIDVVKGQWAAPKREAVIRATAEMDGADIDIWIEQEPGSGGKESAESTIRNLAGFSCYSERPVGDKVVRINPFSVQVEAGNVRMLKADWNKEYLAEAQVFPLGKFKDQMDGTSGAFSKLTRPTGVGILLPGARA